MLASNAVRRAIETRCGVPGPVLWPPVAIRGGLGGEQQVRVWWPPRKEALRWACKADAAPPRSTKAEMGGSCRVKRLCQEAAGRGGGGRGLQRTEWEREVLLRREREKRGAVQDMSVGGGKVLNKGTERQMGREHGLGWCMSRRAGTRIQTRTQGAGVMPSSDPKKGSSSSTPRPPRGTSCCSQPARHGTHCQLSCTRLVRQAKGYLQTLEPRNLG